MRNEFELFIPIVLFISIAMVLYHFIKARHTERMAIIEKGISEEQLTFLNRTKKISAGTSDWTAKIAVLLIGVGLAILIGNFFPYEMQREMITSFVFLFPGIGLLIIYRYLEKKSTETK